MGLSEVVVGATGAGLTERAVVTGMLVGRTAEGEAVAETAWTRAEGVPLGRALDDVTEAREADAEEKKLAIDAGRGLDDATEAEALALAVTVLSSTLGAEMTFAVGGATLAPGTAALPDALIVR